MKFIDGFWLLKNGVKPYYALQVVQATETKDSYLLHVSTKPIRHRGDTLGGPLLNIRVHAPSEGIIGVKIDHFKSSNPTPTIPLFPDVAPTSKTSISKTEQILRLESGDLSVEITSNPYTLTFKSPNKTLACAGPKHQGIFDVPYQWTLNSASSMSCMANDFSSNPNPGSPPSFVRYVNSEFTISPGELFYGLGERFGAFVRNGQSISIWNQDGGTSSDQAYKCIPFYISNRGYGVFVNHPGEVEVEVGSEKVSRVGFSVADESLEYFLIYGETPLQMLGRYTQLTGRPALPPAWTFGLWLSTSFLTNYDSKTVSSFLRGMQDRECNVRVFHFDCFWMKQYEWCSFTFDPDNFPDPKQYLSEIKAKYNVKVCVWINPYVSQLSPIFDEAVEGGFLVKRSDGTPWQWDLWQPGLGIVDITNPGARDWYAAKLNALINLGVDCFKTDFGERIPHANVKFFDGSDPKRMHNAYSVIYNELVFKLLEKRFGKDDAVVFARASATGGQRFPVHWGGDCESTYEAMAEAMRGALSLTLSGFGFASHDTGGFEGTPPPDIYSRWVAFGLFSTHSRLHGSGSYRVPWADYGEDAAKTLAKFVETKHRLMPYIYNYAIEAHTQGHPLMRAMFVEFIEDRTTHHLDQQFMLGPSLLVAPSFVPETEETEYYLPSGRWTSFYHPERVVQGPVWMKEKIALDDIALWVRQGSILLLGPEKMGKPDYAYDKDLEVRLYELDDGKSAEVSVPSGEAADIAGVVRAERRGDEVTVSVVSGDVSLKAVTAYVLGMKVDGSADRTIAAAEGSKEVRLKLTPG
ncbi:alpha-glucosidase [Fomitiporia mediterranea MF3/22]|uniref:alpha-glucosidase n=1 Tax=Fomitiporia mediterranea (strain MF3/22) TaxID=694068 RepID=UPI0004407665|nr:alpha-glucosidase [Fomitiporia mediterranea MF3/22]EJD05670.1 alpha-glucosidase [Fomitiporia mediterranea MF3/22]